MRVLVAGASGLIGSAAVVKLLVDGHRVVALSRDPDRHFWPEGATAVAWDAQGPPKVEGHFDAVVHLAGENVGTRWTDAKKTQLRASRVGIADHLVDWMAAIPPTERPKVFVCASAVGYYGIAPQGVQREPASPGSDYLATLCADWEDAARHAEMLDVRVVLLRLAVVLHPKGGALKRLLLPFRVGIGGPLGDGTQPFPWVHRDDVAAAVAWALQEPKAEGPYNVAAPQQVDMQGFAKSLAATLHRPAFFRVPPLALRLVVGKGAAEVVLGGQVAPPERLLRDGFKFRHPDLSPALADLLAK